MYMYLLSLGHAVGRETATQTLSRWVSCKGAVQQLFSIYIYIYRDDRLSADGSESTIC